MKICILTQFYPPESGAAAIRLSRLARQLVADGHEVHVLTGMPNYPEGIIPAPYKGKLTHHEIMDGVHVHRVWLYATPNKSAKARILNQISFMVSAALRGTFLTRPDVILVESHPLFVCLAAGWLKLVKRAPIVLNVSDLWPESAIATGMLKADSTIVKIAERIEKWAYQMSAHIVAMSQGWQAGILRVYPQPDKVTLIRNAVNLDIFHPNYTAERAAIREKYGVGDKFLVAHIGNMSLTYDFDTIIEAITQLPEMTFLFAGGGSKADTIKAEVEARKLQNVIFTGILPHAEMPKIWAAADACVIALGDHSVAGGTLPAKMYEAFATGTPVVAAIRGEGAEMLEQANAGIVVPIQAAQTMANALQKLANEPNLRQSMSNSGRKFAENNLAPSRVKDAYLSIFKMVTKQ